jgi:hypothetical protein
MPKKLEEALKRSARARGFRPGSDRYNRYVYGTLAKVKKAKKEVVPHG